MQTLLSILRTSNHVVSLCLADLTDEVARRRTRGDEGPSITWTIGHMLDFRHRILAFLGDQRPSPWDASFGDTSATDGADYPTVATMRSEWEALHEALERSCARTVPAALDALVPDGGMHGETSVRDKLAFLAWHEAYHIGVIGAARTAVGLPGPADLARAASAQA